MEKDTYRRLLDTASELFAAKGFTGVSVRDVTIAAKVNVSAVSYYYNGKDGLYQAVVEHQLQPIKEAAETAKNAVDLSPAEKIKLYMYQMARTYEQRPLLSKLMSSEILNPTPQVAPIIEKHIAPIILFVRDTLQSGIDSGEFRPDLDVTYAEIALAGIINFYFISEPIHQKLQTVTLNQAQYIEHACQLYLDGIRNPQRP